MNSQLLEWVFDAESLSLEEAPQFLKQAPSLPNYVPGPKHPPSPDYVPGPEYQEYLVPSDDEVPIEDQPLPADASPTALSPGYIADSDPKEDPEEDLESESSRNADDEDEEEISEEEDDNEEEEGYLASTESSVVPIDDHVPFAEETEPFEIDESAPTPPSPRLRRPRISIRPQTPMAATTKALIVAILSPPLRLPSPPLHAPLSPLLLPATDHREDVPEADVLPQKRLCLNAATPKFEVGESSAAAARQPGLDVTHANGYSFVDTVDATPRRPMSKEVGYGIMDVWEDMVRDMEERAPTTLEELSQRVTDLAATLAQDTHEMRYHLQTTMLLESEATHARQAWSQAMDCNRAVHAELLAYRAEDRALNKQINVLQR
ncbi:hypothetical protein Tco_0003518 [Tanacetum coccineum]